MGTIASRISRPLKNYNIENRAHKVISQSKPRPAPSYDSKQKQIDLVNKLEPQYKATSQKKDPQLDDYLKQVYVESETKVQEADSNPDRPLPKERTVPQEFEYGFFEPTEVNVGKVSLRQAIELINKHNRDPTEYTAEKIAVEYKLAPKLAENILEYYKVYEVVKFEDNYTTNQTAKPIPISLRSGIRVPHSSGIKVKRIETADEDEEPKKTKYKKIQDK